MNIKYYEHVTDKTILKEIEALLTLCDDEFVPPLSARSSTTDNQLDKSGNSLKADELAAPDGPQIYFQNIKKQCTFVALEGNQVAGFLSFKKDMVSGVITPQFKPNIYITTIIVHPDFRGHGIANLFYDALLKKFPNRHIFTRTWSTNRSHLRILSSLKFYEFERLEDDRGEGIDTVYFHKEPSKKKFGRLIKQYHLLPNIIALIAMGLATMITLFLWVRAETDMMTELYIAISTSLMASALCLISDLIFKYRDSKNDIFLNTLKDFGIDNLQFHKDELLERIMPKAKEEIWISGYRLIMTAKAPFLQALKSACRNHRGLEMRLLLVPQWSEVYRQVYGDENVMENYLKVTKALCECVRDYDMKFEFRLTSQPLFNDTYKVDDRFVTGPYLHCSNKNNLKIEAKDFFSLDINDETKVLYDIIYNDYQAVWKNCREELDVEAACRLFCDPAYQLPESETEQIDMFRALFRKCDDNPTDLTLHVE